MNLGAGTRLTGAGTFAKTPCPWLSDRRTCSRRSPSYSAGRGAPAAIRTGAASDDAAFQGALGGAGVDAECVGDESLAVVDGIMVDALIDPGRYPPERLLALLRRALERLVLSA
jgi:hypothetical protein